ncbi:MAG: hypothetical protein K8T91_22115 [Planctomycetes bacterium]|nr:hypothetical protein [Planctomycetota bacterium]
MRNRRYQRSSSSSGPRTRLWGMLLLLVVLAIYIPRARDPRTWSWLSSGDSSAEYQPQNSTLSAVQPTAVAVPSEVAQAKTPPAEPAEAEAPLDLDPEEIDAFQEQAEALSDKALYLEGIEMPSYWRLVRWSLDNTLPGLEKRASRAMVFNHFVQRPSKMRGKLVRLTLNVRRVLPCAVEEGQPADIPPLYEVWGFSEESQAWMYVVITPDLPTGLPVGPRVNEQVTFCGYFLKLQGYHQAGAGPKDKPLFAPLLIGRMALAQPLPPPPVTDHWTWWLMATGVILTAAVLMVWFIFRTRPRRPIPATGGGHPLPWQAEESGEESEERPWSFTTEGNVRYGEEDEQDDWDGKRDL